MIGYIGALSTLRNVDTLIRALSKVKQKESVALVLVGAGKDRIAIESLVKKCGLSASVIFTGAVSYRSFKN